jgi:hypothetical protein
MSYLPLRTGRDRSISWLFSINQLSLCNVPKKTFRFKKQFSFYFCLLNQNKENLFVATGFPYFYGLQRAFEIFHLSLHKKISLFNEPFFVYSV